MRAAYHIFADVRFFLRDAMRQLLMFFIIFVAYDITTLAVNTDTLPPC